MLNRKEVLKNHLKFENKELTYKLSEKLEKHKEQATRLQKSAAENGTLEKHCYYKARTRKLEANKAKKNWIFSSTVTEIRRFKRATQISWKGKTIAKRATT